MYPVDMVLIQVQSKAQCSLSSNDRCLHIKLDALQAWTGRSARRLYRLDAYRGKCGLFLMWLTSSLLVFLFPHVILFRHGHQYFVCCALRGILLFH